MTIIICYFCIERHVSVRIDFLRKTYWDWGVFACWGLMSGNTVFLCSRLLCRRHSRPFPSSSGLHWWSSQTLAMQNRKTKANLGENGPGRSALTHFRPGTSGRQSWIRSVWWLATTCGGGLKTDRNLASAPKTTTWTVSASFVFGRILTYDIRRIFGFGRNKVINSACFVFGLNYIITFGLVSVSAEFIKINSGRSLRWLHLLDVLWRGGCSN